MNECRMKEHDFKKQSQFGKTKNERKTNKDKGL